MSHFDRLAEAIAARSTGPVLGVPGSGATLSLLDRLEKLGREFVLTHFECSAAIMAGTIGRLSGRVGVALSIKGPGLTNMVPGLAVAAFEAFPLVAVVEAYGAAAPAAKAHKRIDQAALTATVSKAITQFAPNGPAFDELAALAEAETPGPVILELAEPAPERGKALPESAYDLKDGNAAEVLKLVEKAQTPIVVAGTLGLRAGLSGSLSKLQVPVFTTAAIKGLVDERAANSAGVYTGVGLELSPEHDLFEGADLVICFGLRPNEVLATRPFPAPAVNIAATAEPGAEAFGFAAVAGVDTAEQTLAALDGTSWGIDLVVAAQERIERAMLSNTFLPAHVFARVQAHFSHAVRGVFDTGYFCTIAEHAWRAPTVSHCLMSGQGRYMGTGIPMGLGATLHDQTLPTVVFLGDGGIGPFVAETKIAIEKRLPVLFCLMTDGRFASLRTRALRDGMTERPLTMALPSWRAVFEGLGMPAVCAANETEVADALTGWEPSQGPAYLEISFDPDPYEAMVHGIR
jgi:thiamine pyrophosphate-dependent acetolactate synthase large subunit-like protein